MPYTRRLIRLLKAGRTQYEIPTDILAKADAEGCDLATIFHKYEA
jgi:hypothetical protein